MTLFDSHLHIVDPRFPLVANDGYTPPPFTCADYRARTAHYALAGGCVVSGSFQGFDQTYLVAALAELGPSFVGVTQLPTDTSDDEIRTLAAAGVRGLRFNVRRGGSAPIDVLETFAHRVHALAGWHVELYADARDLPALAGVLGSLPAASIDHLGLSAAGLPGLLRLAERGIRVKATGFGRIDLDPAAAMRALYDANPDCLMFGTDLPSTRAARPYRDDDLALILRTFDASRADRVLRANAAAFYRVPPPAAM
jgi:predicted TIM-barrel fold metal-dependent hydrolase